MAGIGIDPFGREIGLREKRLREKQAGEAHQYDQTHVHIVRLQPADIRGV